ncbi:MAG TPA: transporter, partial [Flavipsychrobacter sp.]|nr:transporter [Flavipsychrobacter sp.]
MRTFLLSIFLLIFTFKGFSQDIQVPDNKNFQLALFGGASIPIGDYSASHNAIGRAKPGINIGFSLDYYFGKSNFGIGIDGRYQKHKMNPFVTDSGMANSMVFGFSNGYSTFAQLEDAFSHIGVAAGPAY